MNYRMLLRLMSLIMLIEAATMTVPAVVGACYGESVLPFVYTMLALIIFSIPGILIKPANTKLYAKDGFACVTFSWFFMSLFGAMPFVISGAIPDFADAFFETVSGFTTTGASILTQISTLPKGILFWRSETHFIGGMGVLVLMLAIMPSGNGNSIYLMRAEVPGPTKGKLTPKMRNSSMILYGIYIFLTIIMTVCLLFTGMPLYDSVVNALATAGTGGFSVLNDSIAGYGNSAAEWIITLFMFIFGVNFNLYFLILIGRVKDVLKSEEIKVYTGLAVTATALIAINLASAMTLTFDSVFDCLRISSFQTMSIMSTTGFSTVDFNTWPEFSKMLLVILMLIGSCAGSTAGGLKISRLLILFKSMSSEIKHMLHPNSVNVIKIDGEPLTHETVKAARNYLVIYCTITVSSILLISLEGFDFETNVTSVISCINNVGPGIGKIIGPAGNFASFSVFGKLLLSLNMLLGRLEILPLITLVSPSTFKKR